MFPGTEIDRTKIAPRGLAALPRQPRGSLIPMANPATNAPTHLYLPTIMERVAANLPPALQIDSERLKRLHERLSPYAPRAIRCVETGFASVLAAEHLTPVDEYNYKIGLIVFGVMTFSAIIIDQILFRFVKNEETRKKIITDALSAFVLAEVMSFTMESIDEIFKVDPQNPEAWYIIIAKIAFGLIASKPFFEILNRWFDYFPSYRVFKNSLSAANIVHKVISGWQHCFSGLDAAATIAVIIIRMVDICYNASHTQDYQDTHLWIAIVSSLAAVVGLLVSTDPQEYARQFNHRLQRVLKSLKLGILTLSTGITIAAVVHGTEILEAQRFNAEGYRYAIVSGFFALLWMLFVAIFFN